MSVIVVSRNRRAYLEELLESLVRQTFKEFEIILVENASLADARNFVVNLQLPVQLKKVFLDEEQTISVCRNYPFEQNIISAHTKYIYFIDDDDAIFSHTLGTMVNRIEQTRAQVVYANSVRVYCTGKMLENTHRYIRFGEELRPQLIGLWRLYFSKLFFPDRRWLFVRHIKPAIAINSLLFDANLLKRHRFRPDITYGEDSLLYFEMSPSVRRVSGLPYVFSLYRRHGNNCGDPHNFARKVLANPLSFDFCWGLYPIPTCYALFFWEYTQYRMQTGPYASLTQPGNLPDERFEQLARHTPLPTKMATALLYPPLATRYAFFRLRAWGRSVTTRLSKRVANGNLAQ